jgi:hypothetical protein
VVHLEPGLLTSTRDAEADDREHELAEAVHGLQHGFHCPVCYVELLDEVALMHHAEAVGDTTPPSL